MLNIFLDTEQALYWLENAQRLNSKIECVISRKLPVWLADTALKKVAIFEVLEFNSKNDQKLQTACNHADLVIVLLPEFITDAWVRKFDLPNVAFFINGCINYKTKHAQVYLDPYFFWSTVDFYRAHPEVLLQLSSAPTESFDVLLGRKKPHRDLINRILDHSKNVIRYFPTTQDQDIKQYDNTNFEWPSILLETSGPVTTTAQEVVVGDTIVSLSQIIPVDIYNRTCYTLVAETQIDNEFSFFTEKIIKPMLAKRLFIACSGQYYLRNLRKLGFQTFDGIVDESYDEIESWQERTRAVCEEVQRLSTLNSDSVKSAAANIVEHNYQHLMNTPWQQNLIYKLGQVLLTV
jgi:hypothetical protein